MRLDHSEPQEPPHQRFGAGGVLLNPISAEVGHPFTCAEACKYVKRKGVRGAISLKKYWVIDINAIDYLENANICGQLLGVHPFFDWCS